LLISGILGAYFGVRISNFYYHYYIFYPITWFLFASYGINSLVISLIAMSVDISILGIMSEILWISSAVFGIVAAIVYRSDKQNHIVAGYTPPVIQETGEMQKSET
jgi:hypothetical protein